MGHGATARQGEPELADRARAGDRRALDQLYQRHRLPLLRHARQMLGEEAAAQDMVQEAFARALVAVSRTRPGLNFRAWIFRITTNLCLRELNRRNRDRPRADADAVERETPQRATQRRELGQRVALLLDLLPARYRQVLLLREVEELSYAELAHVLGLRNNAVKVLLHRARLRFAALVVSERLLSAPDTRVSCAELGRLLQRPRRAELVRHLECCAACRRLERRPPAELLALLPGPTSASPPAPSPCPAGAGVFGGSPLLVGALVGAALLLVTGSVVAALLLRPASQPSPLQPAVPEMRSASRAAPRAHEADAGAPPAPAVSRRTTRRRRRRRKRRARRNPRRAKVVQQVVDTEPAPRH